MAPGPDYKRLKAVLTLAADADDALVDAVLAALPLDILQLHGEETPARCAALRARTGRGVMKALGESNPRKVLALGEAWRPWRAYAVMHLWQSLTKE